jgi:hypothetical protein
MFKDRVAQTVLVWAVFFTVVAVVTAAIAVVFSPVALLFMVVVVVVVLMPLVVNQFMAATAVQVGILLRAAQVFNPVVVVALEQAQAVLVVPVVSL